MNCMKQETVLEKKAKRKFTAEEQEFIDSFVRSMEDIKAGRLRRVA